ncbi:MAG: hypothetical protein HY064_01850 [Bacteroidetes bacterium]|nr:hypothetical protein [Bacteroidota bacterium]
MKHIVILFSLVFSFGLANAQTADRASDQDRAHTQALRMKKNLTLSDDQTTKVEAVLLARLQAIDAIKKETDKSASQQESEIDAVKTEKDNELATILTADQYAQYKHMQQMRKDRAAQSGE